jgi:hypothetical protein
VDGALSVVVFEMIASCRLLAMIQFLLSLGTLPFSEDRDAEEPGPLMISPELLYSF